MALPRSLNAMALGALLLAAGCSEKDPSPPSESPLHGYDGKPLSGQPAGVRAACQIERAGEALKVRFQLTNEGDEVLHVFAGRGPVFKDDLLCDGGGGAAHLLAGIPPLPPFPAYSMYHPKTVTLAPGARLDRELTLTVPLREGGAYYNNDYTATGTATINRLVLRVDFVRDSKADLQYPDEPRGPAESVSCETPLPAPVKLLRRSDPFNRI